MAHHEAGKVTIKGVDYDVTVDDSGDWHALVIGNRVTAGSKDALRTAITRETRKATASISVPFVSLNNQDATVRRGNATGIHGSNRNVLVRWADTGEADQVRGYTDTDTIIDDLTDAELSMWQERRRAYLETARWFFAFEKEHRIDLRDIVRKALTAAVAEDPQQISTSGPPTLRESLNAFPDRGTALAYRAAYDQRVSELCRMPIYKLREIEKEHMARLGQTRVSGGPASYDEWVNAIMAIEFPAAMMDASNHVAHHRPDEIWSACEYCRDCRLGRDETST
jgi:hypothetical protein